MLGALLALMIAQTTDASTLDETLRRAKNEYAYGHYVRATRVLKGLLYPMRLQTDEQVLEARKYLALCYFLQDKQSDAEEEFTKLLYLEPDYELDPFTVAPPIIDLLEKVRKVHVAQLDVIRERRNQTSRGQLQEGFRRTIRLTVTERSDIATFLPFGIGQFQNGDYGWGAVFAASEAVFLAANIGSYVWLRSQRVRGHPGYGAGRRDEVQLALAAQFGGAALFGVAWSLGVFHARLNFAPTLEQRVVTDELIEPPRAGFVISGSF